LLGVHEYPLLGERLPFQRTLAVIFGALLLVSVIFFVDESPNVITGATGSFNGDLAQQGNVQAFGIQLFTTFIFPFEVTSLLLIVAMVGAVALGRRRRAPPPPAARPVEREEIPAAGAPEAPEREPEVVR
jgi:NADH:ubiquinone oxidoreductase subunit 6 (subunit J)